MAKKRKLKRKVKSFFIKLIFFIVLILIFYFFIKVLPNKKYVTTAEFTNNKIEFTLKNNDYMCMLSNNENKDEWIKSENNKCVFDIVNNTNLYLKKDDKIINATKTDVYFKLFKNKELYLAVDEEYNYFKYIIGNIDNIDVSISDKDIIEYKNNKVIGLKEGSSNITFKYNDYSFTSKVIVTSLISKMTTKDKVSLKCEKYSKEENELLDKILENRIQNAGYKTRAGVVEAARFLSMSFPYKIEYFYENGRQTTNKVDGEGRYYHIGLYLNDYKFDDLTGSSYTNNKGTWGCSIESFPINKKANNGLDCSGFVSWALLNGGFDVKDVGAGWSKDADLTDYGDVLKLDETKETYDKLRVGDLLHSERLGGHIGIIVGIDSKNIYVAQAIWYNQSGLVVTDIKKEELYKEFPHAVLMDKYYLEDGNLSNMWN